MRQYPGAACLAAAAVFTLLASAARADAVIDWNIGKPPAGPVMAMSPSSSACFTAANRPAFCPAVRPGWAATERIAP
jgi:hypothetical protein